MRKDYQVVPRGVALVIGCNTFPTWNGYPGLFASLVTGNPVIIKPHPRAALPLAITVEIARDVLRENGFDPALVQLAAENDGDGLAKTLAEFLFGDDQAMISLDMSEYMEKHTVSRLVGSPPGYVGYEEGGQLTEKVRRKPFSVVLFDEVEKAHPDIFNSLLQILEDGRLTDAQGRVVDFKNTVIIMTTNLGTRDIAKGLNLGFSNADDTKTSYERMKAKVNDELKNHFRPEFLNRIDDIIVFHQLSKTEIIEIVDLMLARLDERLRDKDMGIELTQPAKELLAERGYDPVLGARPLRRTIQRDLLGSPNVVAWQEAKAGFIGNRVAQRETQTEEDVCARFLACCRSALMSGRGHLAGKDGKAPPDNDAFRCGWVVRDSVTGGSTTSDGHPLAPALDHRGDRLGFTDGQFVWVSRDSAFVVAQRVAKDSGEPLAVERRGLTDRLYRRGMLAKVERDAQTRQVKTKTVRLMVAGNHMAGMLCFRSEVFWGVAQSANSEVCETDGEVLLTRKAQDEVDDF